MSADVDKSSIRDFSVVGSSPSRVDAADKVVGRALFGTDVSLSGMLVGKVLRSPHAHARILSIDTSRAEALPGVYAVVTAADLPPLMVEGEDAIGEQQFRDRVLAGDKVLFEGHPVAAVAARTQAIAEEALQLIDVAYEVLPAVVDVLAAMAPDAPILHPDLRTQSLAGPGETPTNVAMHFQQLKGDPEAGFTEADVVVEREFRTRMVHQGYIEPHASTAIWTQSGDLTVYATTQGTFAVRDHITRLLQLPMSKVLVVPMEVGGAFGGKNSSFVDGVAALLARKARRPVKVVMSRYETFVGTGWGQRPRDVSRRRRQSCSMRPGPMPDLRLVQVRISCSRPMTSPTGGSTAMMWWSTSQRPNPIAPPGRRRPTSRPSRW